MSRTCRGRHGEVGTVEFGLDQINGQWDQPKNAEDSERDKGAAEILIVGDSEADVVREDCDHVDDTHDGARVATPRGRRVQPQQVLGREDEDADCIETEERVRVALTARPDVIRTGNNTARHRLRNVCQHRRCYEEPALTTFTPSSNNDT